MRRDPLEGVRPNDALDQPSVDPPNWAPRQGGGTKMIVAIVMLGTVAALIAAGAAFYLHSPRAPRSSRAASTKKLASAPTGEPIVKQGASSPIDLPPAPTKAK